MKKIFTSKFSAAILASLLCLPVSIPASQNSPTADQAKNNVSDREMMKNIRRDVVKDKSLSTYGHNVKIIAEHGKVTLKGPVRSDEEKKSIEQYARKHAGDSNVDNQITIQADR